MPDIRITLCDEKNENVQVKVRAKIINGCLEISGQDFGIAVEESFGAGEYEYFYNFDRANTERLLSLLTVDETPVRDALVSRFGGMGGCKALREFCDANGIRYQFFNYS